MNRVLVSIKNIQRDMNGEDTVVELISPGSFYEKNGVQYVRYEESSVTGLDGVKTTIKIYPDSIVLMRTGAVNMRHQYIRGQEREAIYETPYGDMHMAVKTHELTMNFPEKGTSAEDGLVGFVHLGYDISIQGEWQFYNQLDIHVREDKEHGHERNPETRN